MNYERWEKKEAERELWRPTLRWLAKLMEERISAGRDVVFVQPKSSEMLDEPYLKRVLDKMTKVSLDQCAVGLRCPETEAPIKKPTWLYNTSSHVASRMSRRCECIAPHRTIAGSVKAGDRTVALSKYCEDFSQAMAQGIVMALIWNSKRKDQTGRA